MRDLEEDNAKLKESLAARDLELSEVKEQLASLSRGASEDGCAARASESAVHEGKPSLQTPPTSHVCCLVIRMSDAGKDSLSTHSSLCTQCSSNSKLADTPASFRDSTAIYGAVLKDVVRLG